MLRADAQPTYLKREPSMKGIIFAGVSGVRLHPITHPTRATVFGYHVPCRTP